MNASKKFYRTVFQYEVLSEEPISDPFTLNEIEAMCFDGDCSGRFLKSHSETVNSKQAAELLLEQGSDPSFFGLNNDGTDLNEEEI